MNRIKKLFDTKTKNILSIYFTAGYPKLSDTALIIHSLEKSGVDMIEIGIPFSDPLADGPVIQHSSEAALKNGMTLKLLFEQLKDIRNQIRIPLILMGYLNPVMQYGVENFCKKAAEVGIDGVIIPDLPLQQYLDEYKAIFEKHNLLNILLVTPQTSEQRIRYIDENSEGFIYMVASSSTTGTNNTMNSDKENYFRRMQQLKLKNPLMTGFGISDHTSFTKACEYSCGAIIGTAFIKALQEKGNTESAINNFVQHIKTKQHDHSIRA